MVSRRFRRVGTPAADMMPESQCDDRGYPALSGGCPVAFVRREGHPSGERGVKWKASAGQSFHLAREPVTGRTQDEPPKHFCILFLLRKKGW
ncbi:hypothetical protein GGR21_001781 [Dysgonomonas hofstadii]|uniref:Uncharacterized protein n=1 Tax=Dysgonomonas hofstadii TaxID=637886 RepID=A0A840CKJ1_9BACT|nr:hypothetical protein [Dysgonomonas hofstadii]MBB4035886.1 hypothetical protein [Dysgonomonas hofstadii]